MCVSEGRKHGGRKSKKTSGVHFCGKAIVWGEGMAVTHTLPQPVTPVLYKMHFNYPYKWQNLKPTDTPLDPYVKSFTTHNTIVPGVT